MWFDKNAVWYCSTCAVNVDMLFCLHSGGHFLCEPRLARYTSVFFQCGCPLGSKFIFVNAYNCKYGFIYLVRCIHFVWCSRLFAPQIYQLVKWITVYYSMLCMPSVLWRCWLGDRKSIWPVKNWVVWCWPGYLSGAQCRLAYGPADATATHCLLLQ